MTGFCVTCTQIRSYGLAKPNAVEDYPWGDVVWKVKGKMFAAGSEGSAEVTAKSTLEKQASLILHPNIRVASLRGTVWLGHHHRGE